MPRCGQCGKVNREGALYCQDCGTRIMAEPELPATRLATPMERVPTPKPGNSSGSGGVGLVACPSCGVGNPAGMSFCKMCGVRLEEAASNAAAPAVAIAAAPSGSVRIECAACGQQTPANYSFCQYCGGRLTASSSPTVGADGVAPTLAVSPTPPAGMRRAVLPAGARTPQPALAAPRTAAAAGSMPAAAGGAGTAAAPSGGRAPARSPAGSRARLVSVRPDGTDAASCLFEGPAIDLGRTEGTMRFEDDPYVAPRHARIERRDAEYLLYPLDWINGVFVRVREPTDISDGDTFLMGRQLLRFEIPLEAERNARAAVEHGVAVFGTPLRPAWGRLRQITVAALTLDVYYLSRPEVVLGREEGHLRFPDDEHVSRRHAALSEARGRVRLEDLASSNGTYLRLREPRELRSGDLLRIGDQLLRFEM